MSHFTVVALIDPKTKDVEGAVSNLMKPYDENSEMPPYVRMDFQRAKTKKQEHIAELKRILKTADGEKYDLKAVVEDLERTKKLNDEDYFDERMKYFDADNIKGEGLERKGYSTYNPDSKWDWYSFGGRWNGEMIGKPEGSENGFNFEAKYRQLGKNQCLVKEIAKDFLPFAIITPNGEWHEKGEMGWWGMVSNEKDTWSKEAREILKQYPDHIAVLIDAHI